MRSVFFLLLISSRLLHASFTTEVLRPLFEKEYEEQCSPKKYPFIQEFFENQQNTTDRYVYFTMQGHGIDTGGLGDRIFGLTTAIAIALRFRRKLIIHSNDGFGEVFVPHRAGYTLGTSAFVRGI